VNELYVKGMKAIKENLKNLNIFINDVNLETLHVLRLFPRDEWKHNCSIWAPWWQTKHRPNL